MDSLSHRAAAPLELHSPTTGLTADEAERRLLHNGPNSLPRPSRTHAWQLLLAQVTHFFAFLLWIAVALAYLAAMPQLSLAIALVIVINGAFAFAQESRADRAAERLRELMPASVAVRRDGHRKTIPAGGGPHFSISVASSPIT